MRRVAIVLSALMFAVSANGHVLAAGKSTDKTNKQNTTLEERKARAAEAKRKRQEEHQSAAPVQLNIAKQTPYSSSLYEKGHKGF